MISTNVIGGRTIILFINNWMAPDKNRVTAIWTEISKYVRIHPNLASRPVWCEKMFLCCFSLKAGRKDLTNRPKVLSPHPRTPTVFFLLCSTGFLISRVSKFSIFQEERSNWGGGGGGERTLGLFVKSILPAFWKKQHRNIFSNHTGRLAFGWILTYLKISVEMAITWFLPGAIQLFTEVEVNSGGWLPSRFGKVNIHCYSPTLRRIILF